MGYDLWFWAYHNTISMITHTNHIIPSSLLCINTRSIQRIDKILRQLVNSGIAMKHGDYFMGNHTNWTRTSPPSTASQLAVGYHHRKRENARAVMRRLAVSVADSIALDVVSCRVSLLTKLSGLGRSSDFLRAASRRLRRPRRVFEAPCGVGFLLGIAGAPQSFSFILLFRWELGMPLFRLGSQGPHFPAWLQLLT